MNNHPRPPMINRLDDYFDATSKFYWEIVRGQNPQRTDPADNLWSSLLVTLADTLDETLCVTLCTALFTPADGGTP